MQAYAPIRSPLSRLLLITVGMIYFLLCNVLRLKVECKIFGTIMRAFFYVHIYNENFFEHKSEISFFLKKRKG